MLFTFQWAQTVFFTGCAVLCVIFSIRALANISWDAPYEDEPPIKKVS